MVEDNKELLLIGGGGHAKVVAHLISSLSMLDRLAGYIDLNDRGSLIIDGRHIIFLGDERELFKRYNASTVVLLNGIGSVKTTEVRSQVFSSMTAAGYTFSSITHPAAWVSKSAKIGQGVQIHARAVVQNDACLQDNVLVNTGVIIEHDCEVGVNSHVASGAVLLGNVKIGRDCHIGAGAILKQGVRVGNGALVGMGSVVTGDVPPNSVVLGIPAKSKV